MFLLSEFFRLRTTTTEESEHMCKRFEEITVIRRIFSQGAFFVLLILVACSINKRRPQLTLGSLRKSSAVKEIGAAFR